MLSNDVRDKHVAITGGASGLGAETARLLASRGAKVTVGDRNVELGEALVADITKEGGTAQFIAIDVTDSKQVTAFFEAAVASYGALHVGINNAGIDHIPGPMIEISDDDYERNIAVNLTGVWYCMKWQIKHMLAQGAGHVINLASVAGVTGSPMISAYCAAKHGVIGLTKSAAIEYASFNIRINAVCPSFVRTPMVENTMSHMDEKQQQRLVKANPMKRLGEPQEIAGAIAWLCTDESRFMTGHSVVLDGGLTA